MAVRGVDGGDECGLEAEGDFEVDAEGLEFGADGAGVLVFGAEGQEGAASGRGERGVFGLAPVDEEGEKSDAAVRAQSAAATGGETPFEDEAVRTGAAHRLGGTGVDAALTGGGDGGMDIWGFDGPGAEERGDGESGAGLLDVLGGVRAEDFEVDVRAEREEGVAGASTDVAAAAGGADAEAFGELVGGAVDVGGDVDEVVGGESGHWLVLLLGGG